MRKSTYNIEKKKERLSKFLSKFYRATTNTTSIIKFNPTPKAKLDQTLFDLMLFDFFT